MSYLGTPPQSGFITTAKQRVTSSTNAYVDLDHGISSLADVIVWVNSVKQDSTNLTLTTSTRITLGATLVSSDIVEIAYLGKSVATQTPGTSTVTNDMLAGSIANSKLANSSITLNGSAVSLGGSATVDNTPAFEAYRSSNQTPSNDTITKVQFNTEVYDTDSAYDNSTNFRFTPQVAGKYFAYGSVRGDAESATDLDLIEIYIRKNGTTQANQAINYGGNDIDNATINISAVVDMNGSSDYLELWVVLRSSVQPTILGNSTRQTAFGAYRLIT
jgi:hypothetical protein